MCQNIDARFPSSTRKVLEAFAIFDIDLLPQSDSPEFIVYGKEEISCLGKQFFPANEDTVKSQWEDFKFEMTLIKKKYTSLKYQLTENKLKFHKTSTEWALQHIVNGYNQSESPLIVLLAKTAIIIPVTNAWPERGASAVKRIETRTRSVMRNDMLNALMHISLNGPPLHSKEADNLLIKVAEKYTNESHYKIPNVHSQTTDLRTSSTQTIDLSISDPEFIEKLTRLEAALEKEDENDKMSTHFDFDSDVSSSDADTDDDDE